MPAPATVPTVPASVTFVSRLRWLFRRTNEPITIGSAYAHFITHCKREFPEATCYTTFDGLHAYFEISRDHSTIDVAVHVKIDGSGSVRRGAVQVFASGTAWTTDIAATECVVYDAFDFAHYCVKQFKSWGWL